MSAASAQGGELDPATFNQISELMGSDLGVLIDTYISDTKQRRQKMRADLAAAAWKSLYASGHAYGSGSSSIGAVGVAGICQQLEDAALNEDSRQVSVLLDELEAMAVALETVLTEAMQSRG